MSAASRRCGLATIGFVTVALSGICLRVVPAIGRWVFMSACLPHCCRQFHKKERTLKALKRKALDKNPDEFYFKMVRTGLKASLVHVHSLGGSTEHVPFLYCHAIYCRHRVLAGVLRISLVTESDFVL